VLNDFLRTWDNLLELAAPPPSLSSRAKLSTCLGEVLEETEREIVVIEEALLHYSKGVEKVNEWVERLHGHNSS
jgi:hypothetical protein